MMKNLNIFDKIEFEVEHRLYLTRIRLVPTGKTEKVMLNEFERGSVPVMGVHVWYFPKFDRVSLSGGPITNKKAAYRALYETSVLIGESHLKHRINEITAHAMYLAQINPDPADWRDEF